MDYFVLVVFFILLMMLPLAVLMEISITLFYMPFLGFFFMYLRNAGMPFSYIYKHRTIHATPWKKHIAQAFEISAILTALFILVYSFIYFFKLTHINLTLTEFIYIFIFIFLATVIERKETVKVRISPERLNICYYEKATRYNRYSHLNINIKGIKNIERVYFPEFYIDFDKNLTNKQLNGTYSYVITCSLERAVDGIDITLHRTLFMTKRLPLSSSVMKNSSINSSQRMRPESGRGLTQ